MSQSRKEQIIVATLKLASQKGLGAVSMNMIAQSVGIKKPSLYNHFKSKEELLEEMYIFLRQQAKQKTNTEVQDVSLFLQNKTVCEFLQTMVANYIKMSSEENIQMFYKVVYSERAFCSEAAKILTSESEKMIAETKKLFVFLQGQKLLWFEDVDISAMNFALTVHAIMDYQADKSFGQNGTPKWDTSLTDKFVAEFCKSHEYKEKL